MYTDYPKSDNDHVVVEKTLTNCFLQLVLRNIPIIVFKILYSEYFFGKVFSILLGIYFKYILPKTVGWLIQNHERMKKI